MAWLLLLSVALSSRTEAKWTREEIKDTEKEMGKEASFSLSLGSRTEGLC